MVRPRLHRHGRRALKLTQPPLYPQPHCRWRTKKSRHQVGAEKTSPDDSQSGYALPAAAHAQTHGRIGFNAEELADMMQLSGPGKPL